MSVSQIFKYGYLLGYEFTVFISIFTHQEYLSIYISQI